MARYLIVAAMLTLPALASAAVSEADVDRVVQGIYADEVGAAMGDVDADGAARAADILEAVNGMRNPTWPGPYGAGSVEITFTKNSESEPHGPRPLKTLIYYPTDQPSSDPGGQVMVNAP